MQKYHDEPKQYKGYLKSALIDRADRLRASCVLVGWQELTDIKEWSNSCTLLSGLAK